MRTDERAIDPYIHSLINFLWGALMVGVTSAIVGGIYSLFALQRHHRGFKKMARGNFYRLVVRGTLDDATRAQAILMRTIVSSAA